QQCSSTGSSNAHFLTARSFSVRLTAVCSAPIARLKMHLALFQQQSLLSSLQSTDGRHLVCCAQQQWQKATASGRPHRGWQHEGRGATEEGSPSLPSTRQKGGPPTPRKTSMEMVPEQDNGSRGSGKLRSKSTAAAAAAIERGVCAVARQQRIGCTRSGRAPRTTA
ncbi:unnamed protein product, partial [Laminaria digitata]